MGFGLEKGRKILDYKNVYLIYKCIPNIKMIITDKQYSMDVKLIEKIDLMINRVTRNNPKKDVLLLVEGDEGNGKTTMSVAIAYYVSQITGRKFNNDNLFFSARKLTEFAKDSKEQIIIWDEPALEGMSSEWWKETQRDLIKLLMMARKKRHFIIFNITRFDKFKDNIIERAIGMVRVYARKELYAGKFLYYKKRNLIALYNEWKRTRKRFYNRFWNFHGSFPNVLSKIIDEEEYDKRKDEAISSIGFKEKKERGNIKLLAYQHFITRLGIPTKVICERLKVSQSIVSDWKRLPEKYPEIIDYLNRENKTRHPLVPLNI